DALVLQAILATVAGKPDDLPGRIVELRSQSFADADHLANGILFRPVLPGHRVVDDRDPRRAAGVRLAEAPPPPHRNAKRREVVGCDRPPLLIAVVVAPLRRRLTRDRKWQIDAVL